jgi:hypothetical protein
LSFEEEFENGEREIIERIEPIGKKILPPNTKGLCHILKKCNQNY